MARQRCSRCQRPISTCLCADIVAATNTWPLVILQDLREATHPLGTARLASLSYSDCLLQTLAVKQDVLPSLPENCVLIYPGDESLPVEELREHSPRPLVFLDASWRRSRKMLYTWPMLQSLPRFSLNAVPVSRYRIRRASEPDALSTLEAIVYTLQGLEGRKASHQRVLQAMDRMIDRQIEHMGADVYQRNYR